MATLKIEKKTVNGRKLVKYPNTENWVVEGGSK